MGAEWVHTFAGEEEANMDLAALIRDGQVAWLHGSDIPPDQMLSMPKAPAHAVSKPQPALGPPAGTGNVTSPHPSEHIISSIIQNLIEG